tara:strand:+ start:495 stop:704 length:210 start_codon:yes stop_codon:yes gene_type:complete
MKEPSLQELNDSIQELSAYKEKIKKEVIAAGQKLRMPKDKVYKTLYEHFELDKIDEIISRLKIQAAKLK